MIESSTSKRNEALLNILNVKHSAIAENIANADTPNYKSKSVEFKEELRRAIEGDTAGELEIKRTHEKHMQIQDPGASIIPYRILVNSDTAMNNNGNNVDMDMEMANLAENQLMYNYMADRVSGHYTKIRNMLQGLS
ncbi:flagellar basal body rod protein FlgB [Paenibacillus sp. PK3_47]|uniref:flagellar basal body rod protein FlgB n=1 Tax=Paenibacillus sp. PK3_47 TaxID=2072642 RepID=UPI00201D2D9C|nr:flagellar basal body rod protein FlgB [Paenibacillus sp. PK3_47]UQZ35973.1 flagellar basal body rod protein FlgB [Paenibacillus sp. PK3_47]